MVPCPRENLTYGLAQPQDEYGKYGIIQQADRYKKQREFEAWVTEVKHAPSVVGGAQWEVRTGQGPSPRGLVRIVLFKTISTPQNRAVALWLVFFYVSNL